MEIAQSQDGIVSHWKLKLLISFDIVQLSISISPNYTTLFSITVILRKVLQQLVVDIGVQE